MAGKFIPLQRIRAIKFEEACLNRRIKSDKVKRVIIHSTCSCGAIGCLGIPEVYDHKVELTQNQAVKDLKKKKRIKIKIKLKEYYNSLWIIKT